MKKDDLLFEIQCEELPTHALIPLKEALQQQLTAKLIKANLSFTHITAFATPRRLACVVHALSATQPDSEEERRGPATSVAYQSGEPTQALIGFAASCQVSLDEIKKIRTEKGEWVVATVSKKGQSLEILLPNLLKDCIVELPVPKWMRWGNGQQEFARPVHHIILLYGKDIVQATLLGCKTDRLTTGHRVHHPALLAIESAATYEAQLEKAFVIADSEKRKAIILSQLHALKKQILLEEALLNEVTALVEWPIALTAKFNADFLTVPKEALISAMTSHQKSFPVLTKTGELSPEFIFIANLESRNPQEVITGNERVMSARLSDARFFYETDLQLSLDHYAKKLSTVIYQTGLGTLLDKANRLAKLTAIFASTQQEAAHRAGLLAKADLMTGLVNEFPECQGIMGYYYAKQQGESDAIALAIREHYYPIFSGDKVASSSLGIALSIADKLDTLVGLFGIHKIPTGAKDPFALRRAALGLIRTILENQLSLSLKNCINEALSGYTALPNAEAALQVQQFIQDRFRVYCRELDYTEDCIEAVCSLDCDDLLESLQRMQAVVTFKQLPEAALLCEANKRVQNILKKSELQTIPAVNSALLTTPAETALYQAIQTKQLLDFSCYDVYFSELLTLNSVIQEFFATVLVNTEEEALRYNRLALLTELRRLFLRVADIALLQ